MQSPNFPGLYDNDTLCTDLIQAPRGYRVRLVFTNFLVESGGSQNIVCPYDSLELYDGSDQSSPLIGTYCGSSSPGILQSTGRFMFAVFKSDSEITFTGYRATVSVFSIVG